MSQRHLSILQISKRDQSGGAERVAWDLFKSYGDDGHLSKLAVAEKRSGEEGVVKIPDIRESQRWARFWCSTQDRLAEISKEKPGMGLWRMSKIAGGLAEPVRTWDRFWGIENFNFKVQRRFLTRMMSACDIVQCHNLHGGYFDLRALPEMCRQVPVVLTLHDSWLLSGHCAHSFGCDRWKTGCGLCPDLSIYPEVARDATKYNWRRKEKIYAASRFRVSVPSHWLKKRVEHSMLMPGISELRVIPNGVDRSVFHPGNKQDARASLGLPRDTKILLFAANGIRHNPWKDYEMLKEVLRRLDMLLKTHKWCLIALGENPPEKRSEGAEIQFIPYQKDPSFVARYYQAADIYVHAAKADTFPLTVLEALSCATPVVATAVGGIPEQIEDAVTGRLVPAGDSEGMAYWIAELLQNDECRTRMGYEASEDACRRFDLKRQAGEYLSWFEEILDSREV